MAWLTDHYSTSKTKKKWEIIHNKLTLNRLKEVCLLQCVTKACIEHFP